MSKCRTFVVLKGKKVIYTTYIILYFNYPIPIEKYTMDNNNTLLHNELDTLWSAHQELQSCNDLLKENNNTLTNNIARLTAILLSKEGFCIRYISDNLSIGIPTINRWLHNYHIHKDN